MAYIIKCFNLILSYKNNGYKGYKWVLAFLKFKKLIKKNKKINKRKRDSVRDILSLTRLHYPRALRGRPRPSRRLGLAPPYKFLGLAALSSLIGSSLYEAIAYPHYHIVLFHRLSCDSCSACLLPTVHLGNTPYR